MPVVQVSYRLEHQALGRILPGHYLPDLHLQRSGVIYYIADVDISDHGAEYNFSGALRKFDLLFDLEIVVYGAKDHQARNHQNEG